MAKQKKQQTLSALLRKYLSKKSTDRIMAKILKMAKAGASPAKIQKAIVTMIAAECTSVSSKAAATGTSVLRKPEAQGIRRV